MDPNTTMETIGAGAKAATKFGEILEKVFGPRWTRKQADADAYADQKKLQTIRENPDMEIVYVNGKLNARQCTQEALAFRAEQRMLAEAIRQEENIEKVLEAAAQELSSAETVSNEPVDDDWISRFFNIVKDVSNDDLQYVWGKILAGEITTPKSFSMRTLETVRNLSTEEAETFQKVLPFVMCYGDQCFITSDDIILKQFGVLFSDILLLEECGLVNMTLSNNPEISDSTYSFLYSDKVLMKFWGCSAQLKKISFGIHSLTRAGRELYSILSHNSNKQYATEWAEAIFSKNKSSMKIELYDVNNVSPSIINYEKVPFRVFMDEMRNAE